MDNINIYTIGYLVNNKAFTSWIIAYTEQDALQKFFKYKEEINKEHALEFKSLHKIEADEIIK